MRKLSALLLIRDQLVVGGCREIGGGAYEGGIPRIKLIYI